MYKRQLDADGAMAFIQTKRNETKRNEHVMCRIYLDADTRYEARENLGADARYEVLRGEDMLYAA